MFVLLECLFYYTFRIVIDFRFYNFYFVASHCSFHFIIFFILRCYTFDQGFSPMDHSFSPALYLVQSFIGESFAGFGSAAVSIG